MPPSIYRRFSSIHWLLLRAGCRVHKVLRALGESILKVFNWANKESQLTIFPPKQPNHPPVALSLVCPPFAILTIAAPGGGLFFRVSILIVALSLMLAVRVPLQGSPVLVRKFTKTIILSLLVADWMSLIASTRAKNIFGTVFNDRSHAGGWILITGMLAWWAGFLWIVFSRKELARSRIHTTDSLAKQSAITRSGPEVLVPKFRFADVGGMEEAKQRIRDLVENRLNPQKYAAYGINRNGILLYGPRGSGKTFLAEATAGEFGLNFHYVSPTKLTAMGLGESEAGIRRAFASALLNRPALLFIDEIDALGSARQKLGGGGDPGGGGRSYNNMVIELMQ